MLDEDQSLANGKLEKIEKNRASLYSAYWGTGNNSRLVPPPYGFFIFFSQKLHWGVAGFALNPTALPRLR